MWLTERLLKYENQSEPAKLRSVRQTETTAVCGPWGINWKAPQYSEAVLLSSADGEVCVGCSGEAGEIQPGELRLFSKGGAEVVLKNSGEVVINGKVFSPKESKNGG